MEPLHLLSRRVMECGAVNSIRRLRDRDDAWEPFPPPILVIRGGSNDQEPARGDSRRMQVVKRGAILIDYCSRRKPLCLGL